MAEQVGRILQVSPSNTGGGAERVALDLHHAYLRSDVDAWLALARVKDPEPNCVTLSGDAYRSAVTRAIVRRLPSPVSDRGLRVRQLGRAAAEPGRALSRLLGWDDFDYPASRHILDVVDPSPELVHLHNLHGSFFDLRAIPPLSEQVPTVITLHDTWMLSGHCAYSLDCDRWLYGCGECPYPLNPPAMLHDGSAHNWALKRAILERSRLHVVCCSEWIARQAGVSILEPGMATLTVIRNGVDQRVFSPGDRAEARAHLGIPADAAVVMFAANGVTSPYKDFPTLLEALPEAVRALAPRHLLLLAVGAHQPIQGIDESHCRVVPFTERREDIADHLRASDLFVHATRADNYPLTILEAQSCGVPALVTDVGGTAETIDEGVTGMTYRPGDTRGLIEAMVSMLSDPTGLAAMGAAAAEHARRKHSVERMARDYLDLYERIREMHERTARNARSAGFERTSALDRQLPPDLRSASERRHPGN